LVATCAVMPAACASAASWRASAICARYEAMEPTAPPTTQPATAAFLLPENNPPSAPVKQPMPPALNRRLPSALGFAACACEVVPEAGEVKPASPPVVAHDVVASMAA